MLGTRDLSRKNAQAHEDSVHKQMHQDLRFIKPLVTKFSFFTFHLITEPYLLKNVNSFDLIHNNDKKVLTKFMPS